MSHYRLFKKITFFLIVFLFILPSLSLTQSAGASPQLDAKVDTSVLKVGDIVFCDMKEETVELLKKLGRDRPDIPGPSNDHVLMYIGKNRFIESNEYFYRPLKKAYVGVVIIPAWFLNIWATNFTYGTVDTTQEKRNAAVKWAKSQIGTQYGKDGFFCGELVFRSYKSQGVHIYDIEWDGTSGSQQDVRNGIYLYQLCTPGISQTKRLILVR